MFQNNFVPSFVPVFYFYDVFRLPDKILRMKTSLDLDSDFPCEEMAAVLRIEY
jgi:hypothetical protein